MTTCPTARIVKAHTALDRALADWQSSIRPYYQQEDPGHWLDVLTDDLIHVTNQFRDLRVEAEAKRERERRRG